jgi:phosphoribosylaminoimidazolecarboxamide formyltransferase/IMP cyclohydrolase
LEAVIAPDYSSSALGVFKQKKKNLRVMKWAELMNRSSDSRRIRCVDGGLLVQENQKLAEKWKSDWQCVQKVPDSFVQAELLMAWKVCAHLKSNAIALVSNNQTVGLGMGQVDRISAVESAIQRWKKFHPHILAPVLASDGFFPFPDSIEAAATAGVKWIVQPGGSIRDSEIITRAKDLSVNMVFTGQRCFSH